MSQKSQALWGTTGLTSRKSRKPFDGPRGLQVAKVANPLGDKAAYKSHSQSAAQFVSPLGTKGLTSRQSRKPFRDQGSYKSQKSQSQALWGTKGLKSRKPFCGPRGLQVAKVASPFGDQGAYKSQKSQSQYFWGTKGLTSRKNRKPFG